VEQHNILAGLGFDQNRLEVILLKFGITKAAVRIYQMYRGNIFRVQTRCVPLTIVFRYREIGVDCVQNVEKTFCSCHIIG
jgi:hypothetical protein